MAIEHPAPFGTGHIFVYGFELEVHGVLQNLQRTASGASSH